MEVSEAEQNKIDAKIKELKESKFKQQMLPAWRPVPTFASTMVTFGLFGVVFLVIGGWLYSMSNEIVEASLPYSESADCPLNIPADPSAAAPAAPKLCNLKLTVPKEMKQPVFAYYQLDNFYQNHRRYVKSRDYKQLMGETRTVEDLASSCEPIIKNVDLMNMGITKFADGTPFDETTKEAAAIPCGLIAKSLFNDTFALYNEEPTAASTPMEINEKGIAWSSDIEYKFKNQIDKTGETWNTVQWKDITDEHFIVWMRTAGLPNFRKLWGKIEQDLTAGDYYVQIENNYNVADFSGKKYFVLSTTNMLGGQNYFLAVCYIVVGALCLVFALIFLVAYTRKGKNDNPK